MTFSLTEPGYWRYTFTGTGAVEASQVGWVRVAGADEGATCEPWATEADLCEPCNDYDSETLEHLEWALPAAADVLYELSGRRFPGICTTEVRPLCTRLPESGSCCGANVRHRLAHHPVRSIVQVLLDGVELVEGTDYRLDDQQLLVRLPDEHGRRRVWPCCQRTDLDATEEHTWAVTYRHGTPAPRMGVVAAGILACELAMACVPSLADRCRLPKKVTSVTRQGVTIVMAPSDFLKDGKVGIYEVDLFLGTYNPKRIQQRATVMSPDVTPVGRRTGT